MLGSKRNRRLITESLRRVSLFAECSDEELLRIDSLMTEVHVAPGRRLMGRGTRALQFIIVQDGYGSVRNGLEEIGRVGPGSFIGERTFKGEEWSATVTAVTPMNLLVLNAGELASLLGEAPTIRRRVLGLSPAPIGMHEEITLRTPLVAESN